MPHDPLPEERFNPKGVIDDGNVRIIAPRDAKLCSEHRRSVLSVRV